MKKLLFVGLLVVLCSQIPTAFAAEFRAGNQFSTSVGETITDDLYIGAGSITHGGIVKGDLFLGGGTILLNGSVEGDLVAAGGTITVLGNVSDDIRIGGGTVVIQGAVGGDVIIGGGQIHIAGSGVGGDVIVGGGSVRIEAPVKGEVRIGGGEMFLNSAVAGNVQIESETLTIGKNAVITGNLTYKSPKEATIEEGAKIIGKITYEPRETKEKEVAWAITLGTFIPFLMLLTGALFFGLTFKKYMMMLVGGAYENPFKELGRGLAFLILLPIASVILFITMIGIPIGILGLIGFVGAMIFAMLIAPVLLGSFLLKWTIKRPYNHVDWKSILLGTVAFYVLSFIPIVGWIAQFALVLLTLGSLARMKMSLAKEWR